MDTKEKTLAEQFRSLQVAAHRYLRRIVYAPHCRKEAEENHRGEERRAEIMDKIFACLSDEEQKTMRSYMERVVEALSAETKESGEDDIDYESVYGFPFDGGSGYPSGSRCFDPRMGGFGRFGRRCAGVGQGHGDERMSGFAMPF